MGERDGEKWVRERRRERGERDREKWVRETERNG